MELDHLAISGETLEEARAYVEDKLGVSLNAGGQHDFFATHNALLGLEDGLYLEAIAIDPEAPAPERPRWFDLDRFSGAPRLTNWICRTENLAGQLADMPAKMGASVALQRADLRWRMAVPDDGLLPFDNCAPALMQWDTPFHPADTLRSSGVRLRRLTVSHPKADALQALISGQLRDDRLRYVKGDVALAAEFDTPHGSRILT
ncbi:VOC family protein [Roseobacter sp.]|uniref:VOC family protein n=1 Tax=Roseobacter sp. TaxID=1907202 RepID=UPI0038595CA1